MLPYNITHITNNPTCSKGIGCLFSSLNDVGNGFPFLSLFIILYTISTFVMVKKGNSFKKAFAMSTFIMTLISLISWSYGLCSEYLLTLMIIVTVCCVVALKISNK